MAKVPGGTITSGWPWARGGLFDARFDLYDKTGKKVGYFYNGGLPAACGQAPSVFYLLEGVKWADPNALYIKGVNEFIPFGKWCSLKGFAAPWQTNKAPGTAAAAPQVPPNSMNPADIIANVVRSIAPPTSPVDRAEQGQGDGFNPFAIDPKFIALGAAGLVGVLLLIRR